MTKTKPPSPSTLLQRAIQRSGLSTTAYASEVMTRDPRTVRGWLAGDRPIPRAVVEKLEREEALESLPK